MKFIFQTKNLDHRRYKRIVHHILVNLIPKRMRRKLRQVIKNYRVIFRPSTMASEDPFFHGRDGLGGVADNTKCVLYMDDTKTIPVNVFNPTFLQNVWIISHELLHSFLIWYGKSHRVKLRNTDEMGHPAGTRLAFHTAEVHDRDIENKKFFMDFNMIWWSKLKLIKKKIPILDGRDLLKYQ